MNCDTMKVLEENIGKKISDIPTKMVLSFLEVCGACTCPELIAPSVTHTCWLSITPQSKVSFLSIVLYVNAVLGLCGQQGVAGTGLWVNSMKPSSKINVLSSQLLNLHVLY